MEGTVYGSLASEFCLWHLGAVGRLDSYVVAGNHVQNEFCQTIIYYRQKSIRTKDSLNVQMSVQASLTYLCSFNVCTFGAWLSAFLLVRTEAWVFVIYFRHKNIRTKDSLNVQMSVQASLTYFCSFNVCTFSAWLSVFLLVRTEAWVFTFKFRQKNRRTKVGI